MNIVKRGIGSLSSGKHNHTKETFDYLKESVLCSLYNESAFEMRVKEVYFERNWADEPPNIHDITESLDNENIAIITSFYEDYNYPEEVIDEIVSHYNTIITMHLDDWVEGCLFKMGYPYSGSAYGSSVKKPNIRDQLYMLDAAQYILFDFVL